jgi:hypothetical protein
MLQTPALTYLGLLGIFGVHALSTYPPQVPLRFEPNTGSRLSFYASIGQTDYCPQFPPLYPRHYHDLDIQLERLYSTEAFSSQMADALGSVVRIPYVCPSQYTVTGS